MNYETEPTIQELETAARVAETNTEKSEQILAAQKDPRARQLLLLDELEAFAKRMLETGSKLGNIDNMRTDLLRLTTEIQSVVSGMTRENARLTEEAYRTFYDSLAKTFERHCQEQEDQLAIMVSHMQQKIDDFVDKYETEVKAMADHRLKIEQTLEFVNDVLKQYR